MSEQELTRPEQHPAAPSQRGRKAERPATYQDVLDAPPYRVAEIVGGMLHTLPRPAMPQALASSRRVGEFGGSFDRDCGGSGGWWIIDEPALHFGEDVLVAELADWRRRMPEVRRPPMSRWSRIGVARCCRRRPVGWTCWRSVQLRQ